jgi:hypothetical protein
MAHQQYRAEIGDCGVSQDSRLKSAALNCDSQDLEIERQYINILD